MSNASRRKKVVVSGMGMVTPLGLTVSDNWNAVTQGVSGIQLLDDPCFREFPTRFGGPVRSFSCDQWMPAKESRRIDLFIQYAIASSYQAVLNAKLDLTHENLSRVGVIIGSGIGGLNSIQDNAKAMFDHGARKISPFFVPGSIINMAAGLVSIYLGVTGPNMAIATACTSGAHAIGTAMRLIQAGDADVIICGGAEKALCPLGLGGFGAARALSTRNDSPKEASRPWDKARDGFVLSDGAGILVLESEEHALTRGCNILAELAGFGMSGDAYHMTAPTTDGRGAAKCMQNALEDAKVCPTEVGYINAHGTSTLAGDLAEISAIKTVFGEAAYNIPMSSTKSMTGHLLGAAGAVEAIFSVLAMREAIAPPTINLHEPDEGCDLNLVALKSQSISRPVVLSNSFGFGGTNASLVFQPYESL